MKYIEIVPEDVDKSQKGSDNLKKWTVFGWVEIHWIVPRIPIFLRRVFGGPVISSSTPSSIRKQGTGRD